MVGLNIFLHVFQTAILGNKNTKKVCPVKSNSNKWDYEMYGKSTSKFFYHLDTKVVQKFSPSVRFQIVKGMYVWE